MVALYGSLWVGGLLYALGRRRLPRLSLLAWFALAIVPIGLDGLSHMINDAVAGISGTGFRDFIGDDGSTLDADALPAVIRELRERGYGFARLSRVLAPAP